MPTPRTKAHRTKPMSMADRRRQVAELYLEGTIVSRIAEAVGVSDSTVQDDLNKIRAYWVQLAVNDFSERLSVECAKLENIERNAWAGWKRSCEAEQSTTTKREKEMRAKYGKDRKPIPGSAKLVDVRVEETMRETGQAGDPRFLEMAFKCVDARLKLMGAYKLADEAGKGTQNNFIQINWQDMVGNAATPLSDPIEDEIKAMQAKALPAHEQDKPSKNGSH